MKLDFHPQGKQYWFPVCTKIRWSGIFCVPSQKSFSTQFSLSKLLTSSLVTKAFLTVEPVKSQIQVARSFNNFLVLLFFVQLFFLLVTHSTYADNQYLRTKHLLTHMTTTYAQNLFLRA